MGDFHGKTDTAEHFGADFFFMAHLPENYRRALERLVDILKNTVKCSLTGENLRQKSIRKTVNDQYSKLPQHYFRKYGI